MKPQRHSKNTPTSKKCNTNLSPRTSLIQPDRAHNPNIQRTLLSILVGVHDKFPLSLWCHLLKPTILTLNLLCQSKVASKISTFAHINGPHDFMKKPFAPLGCTIQAHVKPEDHWTWDTWSDARFNLGRSMVHHRCFWVNISTTRVTRSATHGVY